MKRRKYLQPARTRGITLARPAVAQGYCAHDSKPPIGMPRADLLSPDSVRMDATGPAARRRTGTGLARWSVAAFWTMAKA